MSASNARFALVAATANLILCTLVGATLLITTTKESPATTHIVASTGSPSANVSSSASSFQSTATTETTPRPDIDQASGTGALRTVVPRGWKVEPIKNQPGSFQATDPLRASHYVRFGSYSASGEIWQFRSASEQEAKSRLPGLSRLRMEPRVVRAFEGVDWEFTWDGREGQQRRVRAVYWRTAGTEYFIYVSSPASDWTEWEPFVAVMLDNSTP